MAGRIEAEVEKIVEELLENTALELVAVDYVKERDWYLRVFIDKIWMIVRILAESWRSFWMPRILSRPVIFWRYPLPALIES